MFLINQVFNYKSPAVLLVEDYLFQNCHTLVLARRKYQPENKFPSSRQNRKSYFCNIEIHILEIRNIYVILPNAYPYFLFGDTTLLKGIRIILKLPGK
jgi:hypothetical protein